MTLRPEPEGFVGLVELLAGVNLHEFVEADEPGEVREAVHLEVRLTVEVLCEQPERSGLAQIDELVDELTLLDMGFGHELERPVDLHEQRRYRSRWPCRRSAAG